MKTLEIRKTFLYLVYTWKMSNDIIKTGLYSLTFHNKEKPVWAVHGRHCYV
jgi:hypothetical protein